MCIVKTKTHTLSGEMMDEKGVLQKFRHQKIITIEQLVELFQCSVITVRRRLKKWKTYTSINKNGRYYTLPHIPVFDANGLWRHQSVLFSRYGNLKQTIIWMIRQSQTGLSAGELAKIVDLTPSSSFFAQIKDAAGISREKHHGRFVYFSDSVQSAHRQKHKRILHRTGTIDWPTDAEAVVILVELIRHPGIDIEHLVAKVQEKGKQLDATVIRRFLESHDLLKKNPGIKQ